MTFDEAKVGLTKIVQNPDTALAELPTFLEQLEQDYSSFNTAVEKITQQEDRIRTLQDTNARLFLMQTSQVSVDEGDEIELTGAEAMDAFVADIMKDEVKK